MAQKKLLRFSQLKTFLNVYDNPVQMAGKWKEVFKNDNPIILELACGRGEYTVGMAQMHPDKNFIGVDVKGNRMYIGAKKCLEQNLHNATFLRTFIDKIAEYFTPGEVDEIWITFPDPQLRTSKAKKRLTYPRFLRLYQQILKPCGKVHLKTDSPHLFTFTKTIIDKYELQLLEECEDVNHLSQMPELKIKTHYEALDIAGSKKIFYLCFKVEGKINYDDHLLQEYLKTVENQEEINETKVARR